MSIRVVCECGHEMRAKDEFAGRKVRCRECGTVLRVPQSSRTASRGRQRSSRAEDEYEEYGDDDYSYEGLAAPPKPRRKKRPAVTAILRLGLGGFWSLKGAIGVPLCVALLFHSIERFSYAMKSTPVEITPQSTAIAHNDYVRLTAALDYENGIQIETVGGEAFTLVPVVGSDRRLIVHEKGLATAGEAGRQRTFTGRIVGTGIDDEWDLDGRRIKLVQQFARQSVNIPADALILDASDVPRIQPWAVFLGLASTSVLVWLAVRIVQTVQLFNDDEKLAAALRDAN